MTCNADKSTGHYAVEGALLSPRGSRLEVTAKLPHRLPKLGIGCLPEASTVEVDAEFTHSSDQLATPHLRHEFGQLTKGSEQVGPDLRFAHNRSPRL